MNRRRSYAEAMESGGSFHDLLKTTAAMENQNVSKSEENILEIKGLIADDDNNNIEINGNLRKSYQEAIASGSFDDLLKDTYKPTAAALNANISKTEDKTDEVTKNISDQQKNIIELNTKSSESWSNDSVFVDDNEDFRSKSEYFDIYSSINRNTVKSIKRDFVSENDVNVSDKQIVGEIDNFKKDSEISENSNVSRGLSVVDELISEPINTGQFRNSQYYSKKSLQNIEPTENVTTTENNQTSAEDKLEVDDQLEDIVPTEDEEIEDIAYREDNYSYEDRDFHYDSDDMTLDFDDHDIERGQGRNSLTVPNTVTSEENSVLPILYTGRNSVRRSRRRPENCRNRTKRIKRLVFKNGETNIPLRQHIPSKMGKFMKDIVTTLIELQWRWITLIFSMGHFLLWLLFGLMFYVSAYSNGDLSATPPDTPCIENGRTFTGIFAFSVETQVSIGYGEKSPTQECPEVVFILLAEVIAGYALLGALVGIVFAKIARPEKNIEGAGFSKHAVICMRDGQLCLVVRVWDSLGKHVIGTRVSCHLINHSVPCSTPLVLQQQNPVVMWPTTLQHNIDEASPLYDTSAKDLLDQRFEIVFSITGSSRVTGQIAKTRTSYLPHNILWGQRFLNVMSYNKELGKYVVDHKFLNAVKAVDTPLCSARLLRQVRDSGPSSPFLISTPSSPSTLTSPGWSFRRQHRPITTPQREIHDNAKI